MSSAMGGVMLPAIIDLSNVPADDTCGCGLPALPDYVTIHPCESNPTDPQIPYHTVVFGGGRDGEGRVCADCLPGIVADWKSGVLVFKIPRR